MKALCRALAPAAAEAGAIDRLAGAVGARLAALPPESAAGLRTALGIFDNPLVAAVFGERPARFSRLDPSAAARRLRHWERSRLGMRRTVFQAIRRLVLAVWYTLPESRSETRYLGPFHARSTAYPWEGALRGTPRDEEPVRRTPAGAAPKSADGPGETRPRAGRLSDGAVVRAGVCVVGTGAGGAVVAARLAEAGHDVVVLEEGGDWTASEFTEDEAEMTGRLYADGGARATDDLSVALLQGRCVGGGTTVNWMLMLRPPEAVLDEWATSHGAGRLSPSALGPLLDRVEAEVHGRRVPDDAHNAQNRLLLDGARRLGWRAESGAINARDCVRAGSCGLGCRYGAKQSTAVTAVPRALAAGARLFAFARAERIEAVERGGAAPLKRVHVTVLDEGTRRPRGAAVVEAPIVVLAAGAVGTPTILERSGMGGGGVGSWLRLHPTTAVAGTYDRDVYGASGVPQSALVTEYLPDNGGFGFWIECPPMLPGLAAVATPGFGEAHRRRMADFAKTASFIVLVRDGARRDRPNGRVFLDRKGRTRIRYRMRADERRLMLEGMAAAGRMHLACGAREALTLQTGAAPIRSESELAGIAGLRVVPNRISLFSAHVNGTCRVGTDPATSGCDPDFQRHGTPGVYVADGSVLPSAPSVNPQETIMAVGHAAADAILERHRP